MVAIIKQEQPPVFFPTCNLNSVLAIFVWMFPQEKKNKNKNELVALSAPGKRQEKAKIKTQEQQRRKLHERAVHLSFSSAEHLQSCC